MNSSEGPVLSHSDASQSAVEGLRVRAKLLAEQSFFSRYLGRTELASQP